MKYDEKVSEPLTPHGGKSFGGATGSAGRQAETAKKVRTRFAPSPTGYQHVGGIRTALFDWLLARQNKGKFVLRFEDTDKKREVAGADKHLIKTLRELGLEYDEGPDIGGPFAPYRQSERLKSYQEWGQKLIQMSRAYADPYTPDEVQTFREQAKAGKVPFLFRNHRPKNPPQWEPGRPLRFKSEPKAYKWKDEVMGQMHAGPEAIDDFILIKSDGYPTYNFAHIVDDAEMEISHIIRGQEFLASVPNYLNLYETLGLKPPILATVPHILGPDGNKKLSKRDGAKDVLDYIRDGFLPDALINFIASLGWNDGTEQEVFSRADLIKKFRLGDVGHSGAKFDEKRLLWLNGHYIRQQSPESLFEISENFWPKSAAGAKEAYKKSVLGLVQERLKFLAELPELTSFFFSEPGIKTVRSLFNEPVDKQLQKIEASEYPGLLQATLTELKASDFSEEDIGRRLNGLLESLPSKPGILFAAVRIAVTGSQSSPQLFGTLQVLGKQKVLARIKQAIEAL
ncbi:MAG: glutamate--tRNA ligase [Candidatus Saccharimonadales bacterium]